MCILVFRCTAHAVTEIQGGGYFCRVLYIPARVKTVHGIATLLTLEKDILEKVIIPLDNVLNSL